MAEVSPEIRRDEDSHSGESRLESWKAIADYLGRHVTTVQRWEQDEGLPVRRHQHEKRGSIYAYKAELDAWLRERSSTATSPPQHSASAAASVHGAIPWRASRVRAEPLPPTGPVGAAPMPADAARGPRRLSITAWLIGAIVAVAAAGAIVETIRLPMQRMREIRSLAVLPLQNQSGDPGADYFVDGITEALTTDLASVATIRVIARQSAVQYRNSGKPAPVIARELNADALVEGAVQRSGQRVRVDIRLIDGPSSRSLWAASYERDMGDAWALQSEISRAIAGELHLTLDPSLRDRLSNRRPATP